MKDLIDAPLLRRLRSAANVAPAGVLRRKCRQLCRFYRETTGIHLILAGSGAVLFTVLVFGRFPFSAGVVGLLWTIFSPVFTYLIGLSSYHTPGIPEAVQLTPASPERLARRCCRHIRLLMLDALVCPLAAGLLLMMLSGVASAQAGTASSFDWRLVVPAAVLLWLQALVTGCFLSWLYNVLQKPAALVESLFSGICRKFSYGAGFLVWMIPVTAASLILYFALRDGAAGLAGADAMLSRVLPAAGVLEWPSQSGKLPVWQFLWTMGLAAFVRPLFHGYLQDWRTPPNVRAEFQISSGTPAWGIPVVHSVLKRSNALPAEMPEQIAAPTVTHVPVEDEVTARLAGALRERLNNAQKWKFKLNAETLAWHFRVQSCGTLAGFLCFIAGVVSGNPTGLVLGLICLFWIASRQQNRVFSQLLSRGPARAESMLEKLPISPRGMWAEISCAHTAELRRLVLLTTACVLGIWLITIAASPLIELRLDHAGQTLSLGRIAAGIGILFVGAAFSRRAYCVRDFAMQINSPERQLGAWRFSYWGIHLLCLISFWITIEGSYQLGHAVAIGPGSSSWLAVSMIFVACLAATELLRAICIRFMFFQWRRPVRT